MDPNNKGISPVYQIKIKNHLDEEWTDWFENMNVIQESDGCTCLSGPLVDQSALYGLLKRIHQLGLQLISIEIINIDDESATEDGGGQEQAE